MPTQKEKLEILTGEKMPEPTEQLYKKYQMPGTPFWIITNTETSQRDIIMGKYKLNKEPFDTDIDIEQWLTDNLWNNILSIIICATTDLLNNQNKQ